MTRQIPELPEEVEDFLVGVWNTNCSDGNHERAHELMRDAGIEPEVRRFLLEAAFRNRVTPETWADLFEVQTGSPQVVREHAVEFWEWLFGEPPNRAELDIIAAESRTAPEVSPQTASRRRLASLHRVMLTLRRAKAFLPDSAKEFATCDPRGPDSIASLASYNQSMEAYEFEMALQSLVSIAKAVNAGPKFWEVAEEAAGLMHLGNGWRDAQ